MDSVWLLLERVAVDEMDDVGVDEGVEAAAEFPSTEVEAGKEVVRGGGAKEGSWMS
jgi:hypothetical protein